MVANLPQARVGIKFWLQSWALFFQLTGLVASDNLYVTKQKKNC